MEFIIEKDSLAELMRVCSLTVSKDDIRPILRGIGCEVFDGVLTATSLNGWDMNQIKEDD